MDSKKQGKSRTGRSIEGRQTAESLTPPPSSKTPSFSGILTTEGQPTNLKANSPLQICPPPPAPVAFHDFTSSAISRNSQSQQQSDYNISLLGVQMSFQVLSPLSSPLYSPLVSPGNQQHQHPSRFECRCSSTESATSEDHPVVSHSENSTTSLRPETTYFPAVTATSKNDFNGTQSRRVRFRPPALPDIAAKSTPVVMVSGEPKSTEQDPKTIDIKEEGKNMSTLLNEEISGESLQVSKTGEMVNTTATSTTTTTSTVTANHAEPRPYFPTRRKDATPSEIKVHPEGCQTDVTVAAATTEIVPTPDNPLTNIARKITILQRQNTTEEKGSGHKIAQESHGRLSLRPSLNVLSAIRGSLRSFDDGGTGSVPTNPLPNGVIKSTTFDASAAPNCLTQPPRRLTRFSSLLRAPGEPAFTEMEITDVSVNPGPGDPNACGTGGLIPDHRVILMEVIYCCCCCCSNRFCDANYIYNGRTNGSGSSNFRRSHRNGGGGDSDSSERRRGEYSNLIENHRLARLVTLLSILAILGLVLTYIIKSVIEQQHQQSEAATIPPNPIGQNISQ